MRSGTVNKISTDASGSANPLGGVYRDLVDWGHTLPVWQNELLRRITKSGSLTDPGIAELAEAAIRESEQQQLPYARLSAADFPSTVRVDDGVTLLSVGSLKNVNALRSDQTVTFGHQLTVVYGLNASGKSGYARVLKKVFRARVVDEILPNLRDDPSTIAGKASGILSFQTVDGDVQTVPWTDGDVLPANCARFAVLDAQCSRTYIANNELTVAPEGLELPALAAKEVDRVQQYLRKHAGQHRPDKSMLEGFATETPSGRFVKSLSPTTTSSEIEHHTQFGEIEAKRFDSLLSEIASLKQDSAAEARKRIAVERRNLLALRDYVSGIEQAISGAAVAQLVQAADEVRRAESVAQAIRAIGDSVTRDDALGTELWRTFTRAAIAYVASVTGHQNEMTIDGRCALCWQELDHGAEQRLQRFTAFLTSDAEVNLANAKQTLGELRARIAAVPATPSVSHAIIANNVDSDIAVALTETISSAHARATALLAAHVMEERVGVPPYDSSLLREVDERLKALDERQSSIASDVGIASRLAALEAERTELDTRRLLSEARSAVIAFVRGLREAQRYELAARSISTRPISKKAVELGAKYQTTAFVERVRSELKDELRFARHTPLFAPTTVKARIHMRPIVSQDLKDISADRVFSEGERTAIALASFLAEVSITGDAAGLIFDDPISSLDSNIRSHVARRLVKESNRRQVIVLTHDLSFFADLRRAAKDQGVDCQSRTLTADEWSVGMVESDMPFGARSVSDRIKVLIAMIAEVEAKGAAGENIAARDLAVHFYSRLRSTWERFVETEMLGGVVERLEKEVRPSLFYQIVVTDEIKHLVQEGYTRCSDVIDAHDHPARAGYQMPATHDMRQDLALLEKARKLVREGRKQA